LTAHPFGDQRTHPEHDEGHRTSRFGDPLCAPRRCPLGRAWSYPTSARGKLISSPHARTRTEGKDAMVTRLALHTWSLDTTSLAEALRVIRRTGWDAVELRRLDFRRATEAGGRPEDVLDLVRAASVPVAAVGVEFGWVFAEGG